MTKKTKTVTTTVTKEVVSTDEKTLIAAILDRSGSMGGIITDAIGGFNEFLTNQKKLDDDASMSVVLFDDRYEMLHNNVDVHKIKKITRDQWSPRGMTALYDAIGKTINDLDSEIKKMKKKNRPNKVLVAIVTDGFENYSKEFTHDDIKRLIKKKEKEDWQFVYLAAGQDAFDVGTSFGIKGGNTFTYNNTSDGNKMMFASLSDATSLYRGVTTDSASYSATVGNLFDGDKNNLNDKNVVENNGSFTVDVNTITLDNDNIVGDATLTWGINSTGQVTTNQDGSDEEKED